MIAPTTSPVQAGPDAWGISLARLRQERFSAANHALVSVDGFLEAPEEVISQACLQNFAKITPQYPGVRAALDPAVCAAWST